MARILFSGILAVLIFLSGYGAQAQPVSSFVRFSAPDVEISVFGGVPVGTRVSFPSFGMQPDLQTGGFVGASVAMQFARQTMPGWSTYLALTAGHVRHNYASQSAMAGGSAPAASGLASQTFVVGGVEARRQLGRGAMLGLQGGLGLMDHDVTGSYDANAKTLAAMAGIYVSARLAPRVSAGPYAILIAPLGSGSVARGKVRGTFVPGASAMVGLRITFGL